MLTALRERVSAARVGDDGITLTELIVTMTLSTILGTLAVYFFVVANTSSSRVGDQSFTGAQARAAITEATSVLQFADSPTTPGASDRFVKTTNFTKQPFGDTSEVTFYSNRIGNRPSTGPSETIGARTAPLKVDLQFSGNLSKATGTLTETVWKPNAQGAYGTSTSKVLIGSLATGSAFTYCSAASTVAGTGACTTTNDPTAVASVVVTLVVKGLNGESTQTYTSAAGISGTIAGGATPGAGS